MLSRVMIRYLSRTIFALSFVGFVAVAQVGHPVKGAWLGMYGPDAADQRRIRLLLDWENREIVGVIDPGRNSTEIERVSIDYDTWTMTIEADLASDGGGVARFVATGTVDNLGSWTNRRYKGTYTHGSESGEFQFLIN
jgi:hypothetical protein